MAISAPGVGSNLDVNSIVTQLMTIERRPLTLLDSKEAAYQAKLSGYGNLRGALSALQTAASALDSPSSFQAFKATAADSSILSASVSSAKSPGGYAIDVSQLAQKQTLVAAGQTSATGAIGAGASTTLTFEFGTIAGGTLSSGIYTGASFTQDGSVPAGTVTIDASNNSLQGVRDAINSASLGVTASIVKDGSAAPYRLVLQSDGSGAARSLRVSVSGDAAVQALLAYDASGTQNLTQSVAAQDAKLSINGVAISSSSNVVGDALEGISLNVAKVGSTTLTLARDTAGVTQALQALVKAYNDFNTTLSELTKYDPQTRQGGPLLGDPAARAVQSQLRSALSTALPGLQTSSVRILGQAGIAFQRDGSLGFDSGKLGEALASHPDDVARLFASLGTATDVQVQVISSGTRTAPGLYSVDVTTLASQGTLTGSAPAGLTISAGVNDALSVTVDGVAASVTLAAGTYTASALAAQVQAAVNGSAALSGAGAQVVVTESGGLLTMTSKRFGSNSTVAAAGSAATTLFGPAPVAAAGVDVAGAINGLAATGSGQRLTGASGSAVDGLVLEVTGGSIGARGAVNFTRGYAERLTGLLESWLSGEGGIAGRTEGINRSIAELDRRRETLSRRLEDVERRYRSQFTTLDTLISNLTATSNFLTQQLDKLPDPTQQ